MAETNITLAPAGDGTLVEIKVALARIEERQVALQKADEFAQSAADHRHRNLLTVIEQFVPRREIEAMNKSMNDRIEELETKVSSSEKRMWGIALGILGTLGTIFLEKIGIKIGS